MRAELLAVGCAISLAASGMLMGELKGRLGTLTVTRWNMIIAALVTGTAATVVDGWSTLDRTAIGYLLLSGLFAIIIAGPGYYGAILRIGARSTLLLFSLNAPFTAILGYFLLAERLGPMDVAGMALILTGVLLAVLYGERPPHRPKARAARRQAQAVAIPWSGIACGLIAAFGQGVGNIAAKWGMAGGVEAFAAMAIRVGIAAVFFLLLSLLPIRALREEQEIDGYGLTIVTLSAAISMGVGMTMLMAALATGHVGIVSTLASMAPVAVLPMVWARTGIVPSWQAWLGAVMAVAGTGLIVV